MDINVKDLHARLSNGEKIALVDVREPYEHDEFNIGGVLIPLGEVASKADSIEADKDQELVVYCRSGKRSGMAQQMLQMAGFSNVRNLEGGMLAWMDAFGMTKP